MELNIVESSGTTWGRVLTWWVWIGACTVSNTMTPPGRRTCSWQGACREWSLVEHAQCPGGLAHQQPQADQCEGQAVTSVTSSSPDGKGGGAWAEGGSGCRQGRRGHINGFEAQVSTGPTGARKRAWPTAGDVVQSCRAIPAAKPGISCASRSIRRWTAARRPPSRRPGHRPQELWPRTG